MKKLQWYPESVNLGEVKADLGFTSKEVDFPRQPILNAKSYEGENGGFTRITTPKHVFMASVAALVTAGMPDEAMEGKVEISCTKGKLKVHQVA